jgi:hypothetical protein
MKIDPGKSRTVSFTRVLVKGSLNYILVDQRILQASSCKYLGIILRSNLNWADLVNYRVQKAWKALLFIMRIFKKGNSNTKRSVYKSVVRPILEYGTACWDPYREGQINTLDCVAKESG